MSRLDYFTIAIVAVCILAIVFLLYKTTDLFGGKDKPETPETTEETYSDNENTDDVYDDPYYMDEDTASAEGNIIVDDNQMTTDEDNEGSTNDEEEDYSGGKMEDEDTYTTPTSSGSGDYLVLAGSFTIRQNADNYMAKISGMGYNNATVVLFNGGKFATVLVDRFATQSAANDLVDRLSSDGVDAYVQKKRLGN